MTSKPITKKWFLGIAFAVLAFAFFGAGKVIATEILVWGGEQQVSQISANLKELDSKLAANKATIESLNRQITEEKNKATSKESEINDLKNQIIGLNNQISQLNSQLVNKNNELQGKQQEIQQKNQEIQQKIEEMNTKVSAKQQEVDAKQREVDAKQGIIDNLNNQLWQEKDKNSNLQAQNDELRRQLEAANSNEAKLNKARSDVNALVEESNQIVQKY